GAPKSSLLDNLVRSCHSIKSPSMRRVRCTGDGCFESWAQPRTSTRILPHAAHCKYLSNELREQALAANAGQSLGSKSKKTQREAHVAKTNLLTLNLICAAGIPPSIVDNPAFRALANHLEPNNGIVVGSTFSSAHIPAEAARVTLLSINELKQHYNLSLGFDGGTTKGKQSIYTVHVTTADREVYLIKGDEASGFSHTGAHICKLILGVMDSIGRERFSSLGSDSTGNTKHGRELAQDEVPTVLLVPDPNHHLSLTIKDICKIDYFQDALRVILEIKKGLETVGKTRFGTLYWAGYALQRCIPGISELIQSGDKSKLAWFKQMRTFQNFVLELQQLCCILEPIARAIKCLEGLEVTVGDIWKFYVAITAVLHDLFTKDETLSIPKSVRDEVSAIVNKRYDEMIHGPSGDLFLSGFFLDPGHTSTLFLENPSAVRNSDQDLRDSMPSYSKVGLFLFDVLAKELKGSRRPPEIAHYPSTAAVMVAYKHQFEAHTRQHPPFSVRSQEWFKPMQYWRSLAEHAEAGVLAFIAIKIFSILGNSMPEERTVSRFTRIDSTDRASQDASTIVAQTMIYQHLRRQARAAGELVCYQLLGIQCASNLILRSLHRPPNLRPSIGEVSRPSSFQLRGHRVPCHRLS
ncbi:ribonuclease H-like domain-containing protein, partial [Mycena olivaceomarginata]